MKNSKFKRSLVAGLAITSIVIAAPISASAEWKSDDNGYMYYVNNEKVKGWKHLDHSRYYIGESSDDNSSEEKAWYYFDNNGYMKSNCWVQDGYKWYYMKQDGSMAKNCIVDGYAIGYDGAWITDGGWKKDNIGWWFSYGSGCGYAVGWKSFENLNDDYRQMNYGDIWYYFDSNGYMKTGWIQSSGKWYYLNSDGSMARNATIDGYIINDSGVWVERLGKVNFTQDIVTIPEKSVYPLGTTKVKYDVINNTGKMIETYYGPVDVQKYEDNTWTHMTNRIEEELLDNDDICAARPPLFISKIYSNEIDLTDYKEFDTSKPGRYRIGFDNYPAETTMYVEFEIK